ncbi:hypothetical protein [Pseudoroseicyclus aestuarii]|uniref:Uncharacterized protein n=1 Tax=Pseudoroseicyclus aestuarii TaxID=1795041 RepID=A0A318SRG3_9RHOB|nr:hypothetical protein [Pseudoroseicyclus aestuarii]PYE84263.1 hypothetical protein DFP88_10258 [Pseudoroseicyclus aestuarii]
MRLLGPMAPLCLVVVHLAAALAGPALAQTAASAEKPPYRDDRTSAASVVRSYYNAIDRDEFARAWAYWQQPPASTSFTSFADGYDGAASTRVVLGTDRTEGAAGSLYHRIPVVIAATSDAGDTGIFAGCFTLRLADPTIQEPPFQPLGITAATLMPVPDGAATTLRDALPKTCDDS